LKHKGNQLTGAKIGAEVSPQLSRRIFACLDGKIGDDVPLRLAIAAALAFPDGSMTASGLRREADRGRLVIERIAGKLYTTLTDIERMRTLCRVEARVPASGSVPHGATKKGKLPNGRFGSSSMPGGTSPQDALRAKLSERSRS
jgi:hypothetical protein